VAVLRTIRKSGFCAIVVNQLVSDLAPSVTGNLGSVICLRLTQKRCIVQAAAMLGLEDWAQSELDALPRQEAIARFSRYPRPVHLAIDDAGELARHAGDEAAARRASQRLLERIPFAPAPEVAESPASPGSPACRLMGTTRHDVQPTAKQATAKPTCAACGKLAVDLKRGEHRVMTDICEDPATGIPERCDRLGMPREDESVDRRSLVKMGLVGLAGSVGNKRPVFEPTAKGCEWAWVHGLTVPKYHASVVHEFVRRRAEQRLAQAAPGIRFLHQGTGEPGGVRPDSVALLPGNSGHRIAIQVAVAHDPAGEAVNVLKLCGQGSAGQAKGAGWIDLVLAVAINRRVMKSLEDKVQEMNGGKLPPNGVFIEAESLMDPGSDLMWLLERDI
jgi:hypothetical protein